MKHTYKGIDCAKLFFCLCIIAVHTGLTKNILPTTLTYMLEKGVFRMAVPYFFVVSGFFLGKKLKGCDNPKRVVKKYVRRLLFPLLCFSAINIPQSVITLYMGGSTVTDALIKQVQFIIFYPRGALWYIQASIIGALLLLPFLKRKRLNIALALGTLGYMFALLCNNYYFVTEGTFLRTVVDTYMSVCLTARNGVFVGFLLLGIGIKLSELQANGRLNWSASKWILLLLTAYVAYLAEIILVHRAGQALDDGALYITHIVLIPLLFICTLNWQPRVTEERSMSMRRYSTGMYLLHRPVLWCVSMLKATPQQDFLLTVFICFGICNLVYRWKKEPLYSLLQ
ncbi:MAG: acyltransferase [Firmicutes bacterium]|nr:acyltransferase [Bacillota bacterium]